MGKNYKRKILFIITAIFTIIYITWRIFFTIPLEYGVVAFIFGILLIVSEGIGVLEAFSHYRDLSKKKIPKLPEIPKEDYPEVDIFIATHNEPENIIYRTVNGCLNMEYPNKEKIHIHICDDGNREEIRNLAKRLDVNCVQLVDNKHAKAGNINNAMKKTKAPLIVTFDADMIPRRKFLMETVPYFFLPKMKEENGTWIYKEKDEIDENEKIGFIQTPQCFFNPDLFQYNLYSEKEIPNEQNYFFREVNVGRNRNNSPIYAGSNTVISREALEAVGGIVQGNITEDFATGIKIQELGYSCYAIDKALANGMAPTDFKSLIKQRERWGRGCVQSLRSFKFIFSKLPIGSKISYLTCLLYWWTFFRRLIYILSPILYSVFGLVIVKCNLKELIFIWLPSYILYNITLKKLSSNIRNQKWSNIVDTILFPYMILPVFLESIGVKLKKFNVTKKEAIKSKNTEFKYVIPQLILSVATIIGIIFSLKELIISKNIGIVIIIYWLCLNLYFLIMASFFMLGRLNYRNEERYYVQEQGWLEWNNLKVGFITNDISESGLAIIMNKPLNIKSEEILNINIKTDLYNAYFKGKVVHAVPLAEKYKYSISILEMKEQDRRQYLNIVYDRDPSLPYKIESNMVKDLENNIIKRNKPQVQNRRKLPRIALNMRIKLQNGKNAVLKDFNTEFVLIKGRDLENEIEILFESSKKVKCEIFKKMKSDEYLYRILDLKSFLENVNIQ